MVLSARIFFVFYNKAGRNVYAHATRGAKRDSAKLLDKVVGIS